MKFALLLIAALALSAASPEETIKSNLDKFDAAAKAGDAATLESLFADDLIFGHSSAVFENKKEAIAALVQKKPTYTHRDVKIRTYGNTVLVNMKMHIEPNGFDIDVLQVWIKMGKDYKLVSRQSTRLPK